MIGMMLLLLWCLLVVLSLLCNKDIFSPAKFYLLNLGVYFGMIFFKRYDEKIYLFYLLFLLLGLGLIIFEPKLKTKGKFESVLRVNIRNPNAPLKKCILMIWILSSIPLLAQLYLIHYVGNIYSYINNIGLRVVIWQGMGIVLELIKLYGVIDLFYFSILVTTKDVKIKQWVAFILHFGIFLVLGFLSGSRGGLLWNIVFMLMAYHYLRKKISIKKVLVCFSVLIIISSILGIARNGYKITANGFQTGLSTSQQTFDLKQFEYGIKPIQLIYNVKTTQLEYGKTYITPLTNIIPRKIWPNKPDTGGIIFTKRYAGDAWGGYSHLSTGIIAEGTINFGIIWGPVVGIIIFILIMRFLVNYYKKIIIAEYTNIKDLLLIITYIYLVTSLPGLIKSEWTNVILDVAMKTVKIWGVYYVCYWLPNKYLQQKETKEKKDEFCRAD